MDSRILCNFYKCALKSILTGSVTAWDGSCSALSDQSCLAPHQKWTADGGASRMWPVIGLKQTNTTPVLQDAESEPILTGHKTVKIWALWPKTHKPLTILFAERAQFSDHCTFLYKCYVCLFIRFILCMVCMISCSECGLHLYCFAHCFFIALLYLGWSLRPRNAIANDCCCYFCAFDNEKNWILNLKSSWLGIAHVHTSKHKPLLLMPTQLPFKCVGWTVS